MQCRYEDISEAYLRTFEWIFEDDLDKACQNYTTWLRNERGLYWIQGKAASGKSTLMRFISEDNRSVEYLQTWSAQKSLEVAKFYFWNGGVVEQRSQTGLFRTLLHTIFSRNRSLIRKAFPSEWEEIYNDGHRELGYLQSLSLSRLRNGFLNLVNHARSNFHICFFVDGLDEFSGDHAELATFFRDISSTNDHIKFCLSSRPWPVFDDIFEHMPRLQLQDLTHNDIKLYVEDHLGNNKRMLELQEEDPVNASRLINEIVEKARGVFLWVKLVVQSLMAGLRNCDDVSRLRKRLAELPADLETLYSLMLNSVDKFYQRDASTMFQVVRVSLSCPMEDDGWVPFGIPDLDRALTADYKTTISSEIKQVNESMAELLKRYKRYEKLETSMKSCCMGLLEVHPFAKAAAAKGFIDMQFPPISYMHRTVKDYIERPEIWKKLLAHTAGTQPEPKLGVLIGIVMELKVNTDHLTLYRLANYAIDIAQQFDQTTKNFQIGLLEEFDRVMSYHWPERPAKDNVLKRRTWTSQISLDHRRMNDIDPDPKLSQK